MMSEEHSSASPDCPPPSSATEEMKKEPGGDVISNVSNEESEKSNLFCTIEASVVTGFEECARGEAREKFGTDDVKAVRGKITWKVPVERVTDVVKMGSIDNARVVVLSMPHFKFTDQYDSLARLQQIVPSVDWESGLRVWGKFNDFPHPIASKPDVIPSMEDLIDVCIAKQPPPPSEKSEKKNRKGGRGKKKEKEKKRGKKPSDSEVGSLADGSSVNEGSEGTTGETPTSLSEGGSKTEELDHSGSSQSHATEVDSEESAKSDLRDDSAANSANSSTPPAKTAESNDTEQSEFVGKSPKVVIIKKADRTKEEPKVEIRVLIPGPNENVFPSQVDEGDARELEPMEVDQSMNLSKLESSPQKSPSDPAKSSEQSPQSAVMSDTLKNEDVAVPNGVETKVDESSEVDGASPSKSSIGVVAEFASAIINKLKTPPNSPEKSINSPNDAPLAQCVTPPPTPVHSAEKINFFRELEKREQAGSSVDPPSFPVENPAVENQGFATESPLTEEGIPRTPEPSQSKDNLPTEVEDSVSNSLSVLSGKEKPCNEAALTGVQESASTVQSSITTNKSKETGQETKPVRREPDPNKPTFRVTCNRVGEGHPFDSASAAASFGSAIITYFDWGVNLKNFDIEVLLNIDNEEVTVSLALTKTSLHNRNLVAFGPTTLRATICYNMLRLCRIRNGDFICDPMCGTSALPVEGAVNWTNCFHFGGDFHPMAMERTAKNIAAVQEKSLAENKTSLKIDAVRWNIENFPLRDKCVDVFVSDLPFGHRMGSRATNRVLYPCLLTQMARTARTGARACLLTEDKTSLIKAIQSYSKYWQRRLVLSVNIGGLSGFVFLLTRTTAALAPSAAAWKHQGTAEAEQGGSASASPSKTSTESLATQSEVVTGPEEGVEASGASSSSEVNIPESGESAKQTSESTVTEGQSDVEAAGQDSSNTENVGLTDSESMPK